MYEQCSRNLDNIFLLYYLVPAAPTAYSYAYFGQGSDSIYLDNVGCFGDEPSLLSCVSQPIGTHNCGHSEDAGVRCDGNFCAYLHRRTCNQFTSVFLLSFQFPVLMVRSDYQEPATALREGWRCVWEGIGEQFVMIDGVDWMHRSFVTN